MNEAMWGAISSWFTPTVLFCLLNLVVATIFITSSLKPTKKQEQRQNRVSEDDPVQLFRVPSLLERVKSISFSRYRAEQPYPFPVETQYVEPNEEHVEKVEDAVQNIKDDDEEMESHVARSKSDTCLEGPVKRPAKMKKSESAKMGVVKEKEVDRRRPATVRERKGKWSETTSFGEDEAVDAKADDFINRFKQQLKLQRIDSILRYKRN